MYYLVFIHLRKLIGRGRSGGTKMSKTKPFTIERQLVMDAYLKVKANKGSAGVDEISIGEFDKTKRIISTNSGTR